MYNPKEILAVYLKKPLSSTNRNDLENGVQAKTNATRMAKVGKAYGCAPWLRK